MVGAVKGRWFNIYLFLKGTVLGRWWKFRFLIFEQSER